MNVVWKGKTYTVYVPPGPAGKASFNAQLQRLTGMSMAQIEALKVTFQCRAPDTAKDITLKGLSAIDAALHCVAVDTARASAARRSSTGPSVLARISRAFCLGGAGRSKPAGALPPPAPPPARAMHTPALSMQSAAAKLSRASTASTAFDMAGSTDGGSAHGSSAYGRTSTRSSLDVLEHRAMLAHPADVARG